MLELTGFPERKNATVLVRYVYIVELGILTVTFTSTCGLAHQG